MEIILEDDGVRLAPRIPDPELVQVGKRLVVRPLASTEDRTPVLQYSSTPVDVAKLIEQERDPGQSRYVGG